MRKIAFIGCTKASERLLQVCFETPETLLVGVVGEAPNSKNNDYVHLKPFADQKGLPYLDYSSSQNDQLPQFLTELQPDLVLCFGWHSLLSEHVLSIPRDGVWGFHPTQLPWNRGRHPIIWTLVLGLEKTASTFFRMDGHGPDTGPIVSQELIQIAYEDDAQALYDKILKKAEPQLKQALQFYAAGKLIYRELDYTGTNIWRKRSRADGLIDWRMPARNIYNLVRALGKPYSGACALQAGKEIVIWKVCELPNEGGRNMEPGKILRLMEGRPVVQCGDHALWVEKFEGDLTCQEGDYFL